MSINTNMSGSVISLNKILLIGGDCALGVMEYPEVFVCVI